MRHILTLLGLILITNNIAYAQCGYHPPQPQANLREKSSVTITVDQNLDELAKVTKKEAKKIATKEYPGKVKKVELVADDGTLVWKLEVKGNEGQKEVFVDPANGHFLGYGLTK
ncbi:MAG: hypothetical protein A3B68_02615 [Candidatus Melainabacteria bacterium RIFCSPHIGHO2_02_FULL_34_12]|nr:MAG: hypothetical protein A3B68_02615 [Candidatus Melainabacteria bacterium RIFCSPHIGHO2_02_FULL_34_12]